MSLHQIAFDAFFYTYRLVCDDCRFASGSVSNFYVTCETGWGNTADATNIAYLFDIFDAAFVVCELNIADGLV